VQVDGANGGANVADDDGCTRRRLNPWVLLLYSYPFDGPEWLFEPKYDGFRGLSTPRCSVGAISFTHRTLDSSRSVPRFNVRAACELRAVLEAARIQGDTWPAGDSQGWRGRT